jgi:hypothetical protein
MPEMSGNIHQMRRQALPDPEAVVGRKVVKESPQEHESKNCPRKCYGTLCYSRGIAMIFFSR